MVVFVCIFLARTSAALGNALTMYNLPNLPNVLAMCSFMLMMMRSSIISVTKINYKEFIARAC